MGGGTVAAIIGSVPESMSPGCDLSLLDPGRIDNRVEVRAVLGACV